MTDIQVYDAGSIVEQVIIRGDISKLRPEERAEYYTRLCKSLGLNPLTKPFEYIILNGKMTLYALKGATDQLRRVYGVSITNIRTEIQDDLMIVTATATDKHGRTDVDVGAVMMGNLKGEARANAIMKAITKAKRRVTLSLCGLGMLDESEVETIPNAVPYVEPVEPVRIQAPLDTYIMPSDIHSKDDFFHAVWQAFGYTEKEARAILAEMGRETLTMSIAPELWAILAEHKAAPEPQGA
jgi:hypothetical protein